MRQWVQFNARVEARSRCGVEVGAEGFPARRGALNVALSLPCGGDGRSREAVGFQFANFGNLNSDGPFRLPSPGAALRKSACGGTSLAQVPLDAICFRETRSEDGSAAVTSKPKGLFRIQSEEGQPDRAFVESGTLGFYVPEPEYRESGFEPDFDKLPREQQHRAIASGADEKKPKA